jgi:hypothetical protein
MAVGLCIELVGVGVSCTQPEISSGVKPGEDTVNTLSGLTEPAGLHIMDDKVRLGIEAAGNDSAYEYYAQMHVQR